MMVLQESSVITRQGLASPIRNMDETEVLEAIILAQVRARALGDKSIFSLWCFGRHLDSTRYYSGKNH